MKGGDKVEELKRLQIDVSYECYSKLVKAKKEERKTMGLLLEECFMEKQKDKLLKNNGFK